MWIECCNHTAPVVLVRQTDEWHHLSVIHNGKEEDVYPGIIARAESRCD